VDPGRQTRPGEGDGEAADRSPVTSSVGDAVDGGPDGFRDEAAAFVDFWAEYDLDYTPASLPRLDDYIGAQQESANHVRVETDDGSEVTFAPLASSAACYYGEPLVRNYDAEWVREGGGWAVQIRGPDDAATANVFHVAHDCLEEEPKFAFTHDVLLDELGIERARLGVSAAQAVTTGATRRARASARGRSARSHRP
jgi:hypothetical protein